MSNSDATASKTSPRRTKSRVPSVYFRENAKGKRTYEFTFRDATGRQKWRSGFSSLKEAEHARGEVMRRLRKGEKVEPIKATFSEFADTWLAGQTQLRPNTYTRYAAAIENHLKPSFGNFRLGEITTDHVALFIADKREKGLAPSTIKSALLPLSLVLNRAVRRGAIATNPVAALERSERPAGGKREMRILERGEITRLLEVTPDRNRPLIATLLFTGLRISEALGLVWSDIDFEKGAVNVRCQLEDETRERVKPKTANAVRSVVLMPALGKMLKAHRLASEFSTDDAFVFSTKVGGPMNRHNVAARIFRPAVKAAGLQVESRPNLRLHDLRHTCASVLIAGGANVVFVSRQLGHSGPAITLNTYSHLFDQHIHAEKMSAMLEDQFATSLRAAGHDQAALRAIGTG